MPFLNRYSIKQLRGKAILTARRPTKSWGWVPRFITGGGHKAILAGGAVSEESSIRSHLR